MRVPNVLSTMVVFGVFLVAALFGLFPDAKAQFPYDYTFGAVSVPQVQESLVWLGQYAGPIDGESGPSTISAIKQFQQSIGQFPSGNLSPDDLKNLLSQANQVKQSYSFARIHDDFTGVTLGLPTALVTRRERKPYGSDYTSADARTRISVRYFRTDTQLPAIQRAVLESLSFSKVSYSVVHDSWFVVAGETATQRYYIRYHSNGQAIAGFMAIYPVDFAPTFAIPLAMTSFTLQSFATQPDRHYSQKLPRPYYLSVPTLPG
jgi:serine protease Do